MVGTRHVHHARPCAVAPPPSQPARLSELGGGLFVRFPLTDEPACERSPLLFDGTPPIEPVPLGLVANMPHRPKPMPAALFPQRTGHLLFSYRQRRTACARVGQREAYGEARERPMWIEARRGEDGVDHRDEWSARAAAPIKVVGTKGRCRKQRVITEHVFSAARGNVYESVGRGAKGGAGVSERVGDVELR